jgi:hypothetical protein
MVGDGARGDSPAQVVNADTRQISDNITSTAFFFIKHRLLYMANILSHFAHNVNEWIIY